jgi:putative NADH-flavin reductase
MIKKIALFGATGQTGQKFLEIALNKGYEVKVLVRDRTKLKSSSQKLTVIQGDILNLEDVEKAVDGTDIVVSLFGHVKGSVEWLQTDGTKNIISAMEKYKVERILSLSGGGLPFPEKDKPKFADHLIRTIMKIAVPKVLNDAIAHADILKRSNKKWVIVRGPRLTNDVRNGSYRIGWVGINASTKISRSDLADFILTQVEDESFNFQMPFVSV